MVVVSSLTYRYAGEKTLTFPDFAVEKGKACLLLGNSGSGKTTLLHLMGGLLKIQQGKVEIGKQDLSLLPPSKVDRFRGKNMGFIFQRNHLIAALTVKKNLLMAPFLANLAQDEQRVDEVLAELGLSEKKNAEVRHLSQGQAQRVAIARALLNRPAVIFADEPTSALDDRNCERVISMLLEVSKQNDNTLIVATHDHRLKSVISEQVLISNAS
jgi:ABC-type lipoprotein export system ATPase subunit